MGTKVDTWPLVERAKAGDSEAFAQLYTIYYARLRVFAENRADPQLADDFVQNTFTKAWDKISTVSWQGTDILAWLYTICRNLIADHYRRRAVRKELPAGDLADLELLARPARDQPTDEAAIASGEFWDLVEALKKINRSNAQVLALRYLVGLDVPEMAGLFQLSPNAVGARGTRGIKMVRKILGEQPR